MPPAISQSFNPSERILAKPRQVKMGNQNSKGSGTGTPRSASQTSLDRGGSDNLQSYPSFSKADTKESTRSFRALKSKIPGGSKTDSPRASTSGLPNGETNRSAGLKDQGDASPTSPGQDSADDMASPTSDDPKPPPSPIQSASMRAGHHDVDGMYLSE